MKEQLQRVLRTSSTRPVIRQSTGLATAVLVVAYLVGFATPTFAQRQATTPKKAVAAPSVKRFGNPVPATGAARVSFADRFSLSAGDVVVFVGQTDMVRSRQNPTLEVLLARQFASAKPRFRNMAWEGDTVYEQWRDIEFGTWEDQLRYVGATVVIAQFGQMEALDGIEQVDQFIAAYEQLLDQFEKQTSRIVLLSPRPFEEPRSKQMPSHVGKQRELEAYVRAISQLAERRHYLFVDLFTPFVNAEDRLTTNGIHLTPEAQSIVGKVIASKLGSAPTEADAALSGAIREKNRLWFDNWRPMNWSFAFGDRTSQPFGKPGGGKPALRVELEEFQPLIAAADQRIHEWASQEVRPRGPGRNASAPTPRRDESAVTDDDDSIAAQLEAFTLIDGFDVNLFASEADGIVKPAQMRWDDQGRLWVLCIPTYPHIDPGGKPADYVVVCEDTDGDGRADKFERFAEGLFMPMGIEFGGGGVYLCEATELVHLKDTDGDGRADTRTVLLSGFGTADSHQMINSLTWGPAGELWFTQGHHAYSHVETPWGIARLHKSGLWRYRPRTGRLQSFFNMSSGGLNCQGVTYDRWGQIFHNSAAWSGGFYTVAGMIPTERPLKYMALAVPDRRNTGFEFLDTEHVASEWRGTVVWGGYLSNSVHLHRVVDDGGGYTAEVLPDLLTSSRIEFRPVNIRVGPDGGIYVCDWYNAIIGHYQASYRDPKRDRSHGRIWRITATDRPLVSTPEFTAMSPIELLEALRSPEGLTRYHAKRRLFDLPTEQAIRAVDNWLASLEANDAQADQLLLQAVGIYEAHEVVRPDALQRLLQADDARARAYAARVVGNWASRLANPLELLRGCALDDHPRVRLGAIVACSHIPLPESVSIAALAAEMPRDRYIDYALSQCVDALKPVWYPALERGELDLTENPDRLRVVLELSGSKDTAGLIRQLAEDPQLSGEGRESLLALLVEVGNPDQMRFALEQAPQSTAVMTSLLSVAEVHRRKPVGELRRFFDAWISSPPDSTTQRLWIELAGVWRLTALSKEIRRAIGDAALSEDARAAGIIALARLEGADSNEQLQAYLEGSRDRQLISEAVVEAVGMTDLPQASSLAAPLLADSRDQAHTARLLQVFLRRADGAKQLAHALAQLAHAGSTISRDNAILMHRALSAAGRQDEPLLQVINGVLATEQKDVEFSLEFVQRLAGEVMEAGDAAKGRQVYQAKLANCSACHKIAGQGGDVGPDLSIIGAGRTLEALIESVLWPNRQVREGFMSVRVLTIEGHLFVGYSVKETDDEFHLRDPSTGEIRKIRVDDIEEVSEAGSLMPSGLTAAMTGEEVRDLMRFIFELGRGGS